MVKHDAARSGANHGSCCAHSHSSADAAPSNHAHHHHDHAVGTVVDPVCGMKVDPATARHKIDYGGETFYFCSERCRTKFEGDPAKYVHGKV